jgi:hypothetical protein
MNVDVLSGEESDMAEYSFIHSTDIINRHVEGNSLGWVEDE